MRILKIETDEIYPELVRMLFLSLPQTCLITLASAIVALIVDLHTSDALARHFAVLVMMLSPVRPAAIAFFHLRRSDSAPSRRALRMWEAAYGVSSVAFALSVGLLAARTMAIGLSADAMLAFGLALCYSSGVTARVAFRPIIAFATSVSLLLPMTISAFLGQTDTLYGLGPLLMLETLSMMEGTVHGYRSVIGRLNASLKIERLSRVDQLTGLLNRAGFQDGVERAFRAIHKSQGEVGLLCLDLDFFKQINDRHGHPAGDEVLRQAGLRLRSILRESDIAARVGGDEFHVLIAPLPNPEAAMRLAERMIAALSVPYRVFDLDVSIGVSVGIAGGPLTGPTITALVARADRALYKAKEAGRGTFRYSGEDLPPAPKGPRLVRAA